MALDQQSMQLGYGPAKHDPQGLLMSQLAREFPEANKGWGVPTPLGLGTQTSPTLIQAAEVVEVTGKGHALR